MSTSDEDYLIKYTYNSETNEYTMKYKYYVIDFYNYSSLDDLQWQDAVGIARSFELYGCLERKIIKPFWGREHLLQI